MSNAEYVRAVLLRCPHIKAGPNDMLIDFLDKRVMRYSIEAEPTTQVVKRYRDGDTLRRYSFALVSRQPTILDADRAANAENYENLSLWLEQQTWKRLLPERDDATPRKIEATGAPILLERAEDGDTAVYMMQIEMTYHQKAR